MCGYRRVIGPAFCGVAVRDALHFRCVGEAVLRLEVGVPSEFVAVDARVFDQLGLLGGVEKTPAVREIGVHQRDAGVVPAGSGLPVAAFVAITDAAEDLEVPRHRLPAFGAGFDVIDLGHFSGAAVAAGEVVADQDVEA
jgi:hypothetical protein